MKVIKWAFIALISLSSGAVLAQSSAPTSATLSTGPEWIAVPIAETEPCLPGDSWSCLLALRPPLDPGQNSRVNLRYTIGGEKISSCEHDRPPEQALLGEQACAFLARFRFSPGADPIWKHDFHLGWAVPEGLPQEALSRPAVAATLQTTGYERKLQNGKPDPCKTLVCGMDYPPRALREEAQGVAGFHALVTAEGVASRCWLSQPTMSEALNDTSCAIILQRARFTPARDEKGAARMSIYSGRLRWAIPQ